MDQYKDDESVFNFNKYKEDHKVVQCIDKPSIFKLIGDLKNKTIIDYGCGSGFYTRLFAVNATKAVGVDYSANMIELCKKFDSKSHQTNAEYYVGNCAEPLNLGTYDIVFSSFLLSHANSKEMLKQFVNSMFESTKPGGVCCGITYNTHLKWDEFKYLRKYGYDMRLPENPKEGEKRYIKTYDVNTDKLLFEIQDHYIDPNMMKDVFLSVGYVDFKWINTSLDENYLQEKDYLADYLAHPNGIMYYCKRP